MWGLEYGPLNHKKLSYCGFEAWEGNEEGEKGKKEGSVHSDQEKGKTNEIRIGCESIKEVLFWIYLKESALGEMWTYKKVDIWNFWKNSNWNFLIENGKTFIKKQATVKKKTGNSLWSWVVAWIGSIPKYLNAGEVVECRGDKKIMSRDDPIGFRDEKFL